MSALQHVQRAQDELVMDDRWGDAGAFSRHWTSLSLSAGVHLNALNDSYDRKCIFEHVQWR
jgi:hypothetical protein